MAERESGQAVFAQRYHQTARASAASLSYWRARVADSSKGHRILLWVVFMLVLPLATARLIRRLTAEESNTINLVMLLGYTAVDVLAALALTGFWIQTVWTAGALVGALATGAFYNYRIATLMEELQR